MRSQNRIWLSPPHMGGEELKYINDAFKTNWIAPLGPHVDGFEQDILQYLGIRYAAALNSGTSALHLALKILGVKENDLVICPSFTFSASANPVLYERAIPVFVDSDQNTWNMDADLLEGAVDFCLKKKKRKPAAIIVVHLYGMPANMKAILAIAKHYDIPVIEDAAESLGSKYEGRYTGTFGALNVLSFNGNKIITCSGGGALLSNKKEYIEKAKFLATQARDKAAHYQHSQVGYNYRLSNVCAAIGRGQMKVLEQRIQKRRENFNFYQQTLGRLNGISFPAEPEGYFSNRWLTTMLVDPKATGGVSHKHIISALQENNIESRPLWKPLHLQPVFKKYPSFTNGTCERLFKTGICLPSGSSLNDSDLERVSHIIKSGVLQPTS